MAASPARSSHWSPTTLHSPVASGDQLPPVVVDFLKHVEDSTELAVEATPPLHTRPFVPLSTLSRYLTDDRVRKILSSSYSHVSACAQVRSGYLRVFTILVRIRKLSYLRHFLANPRLSDTFLPFVNDSGWQGEPRDFFHLFFEAQWQFCAQKLEPNILNGDYHIDERVVIPIVRRRVIKEGPDSTSAEVEVHPDYNHLVARDKQDHPITNTFFLKTCAADYAEYHHNEVEAYRTLSQQEDVLPYFARFYGSWIRGQTYHMLLEYVGGGTLTHFMDDSETPAHGEQIIRFWASLLDLIKPLMRLHRLPLQKEGRPDLQCIHHDIKPDNILVTARFGISRFDVDFKLADLGLTEFDYFVKRSGERASKNIAGTQMYSPPELCVEEDDMYLQRTIQQAKPTKDMWSLACVFSEAAVWVVQGREGLDRYRLQRTTATNAVEKLRETSHAGCFHDGKKVLQEVLETHMGIRRRHRNNDYITDKVLDLVENMLGDESSRPDACRVYEKSQAHLKTATRLLQHDRNLGNDYVFPEIFVKPEPPSFDRKVPSGLDGNETTGFDRPEPPELPPELFTNELGFSFDPFMHLNSTNRTRVSSPFLPASPRSRYSTGYEVITDRQSPLLDRTAMLMTSNQARASRVPEHAAHGPPVRSVSHLRAQQRAQQRAQHGINLSQPSKPAISKQRSEPNREDLSHETLPTPPAAHEQGKISNFVHQNTKGSTRSKVDKNLVDTRTTFPEASIEQVESWIRRVQLNRRTPLLDGNDWLRWLNGRDQIFLFDDSGSMRTHWRDAIRAFLAMSYLVKGKDPDGIEIRTTTDPSFKKRSKTRTPLHKALSNHPLGGQCDISLTLSQILRELHLEETKNTQRRRFFQRKQNTGVNIYVLTDGVWEGGNAWLAAIAELLKNLVDRGMLKGQLSIQFIQFGSDEIGTDRLRTLDDHMYRYGVKTDFIDTEHFNGNIFKMLLGSLDATVDGQPSSTNKEIATPDLNEIPSAKIMPQISTMHKNEFTSMEARPLGIPMEYKMNELREWHDFQAKRSGMDLVQPHILREEDIAVSRLGLEHPEKAAGLQSHKHEGSLNLSAEGTERHEKPEKPEKTEKSEKTEQPEKPEKPEIYDATPSNQAHDTSAREEKVAPVKFHKDSKSNEIRLQSPNWERNIQSLNNVLIAQDRKLDTPGSVPNLSGLHEVSRSIDEGSHIPQRFLEDITPVPRALIKLETHCKQNITDSIKGWIEDATEQNWDWWPLLPRNQPLGVGRVRVRWRCFCGKDRWYDLSSAQRTSLEKLLSDPPTSRKPLLCESIRHSSKSKENTRLPRDGEFLKDSEDAKINPHAAPRDGSLAVCTGSSSNTTNESNSLSDRGSRSTRSDTVGSSQTSADDSVEAEPQQLWLLFGVHGPGKLLSWDQLDKGDLSSDHLFIRKIRRKHAKMRGRLRLCFSVWQVRYWEFVKFRRTARFSDIDDRGPSLPSGIEYHFHGKGEATIEDPGISEHEFDVLMTSCLSACWLTVRIPAYRHVHDCYELAINSKWYVDRLPKRTYPFHSKPGEAPEDEDLWGIRAGYKVSAIHVFAYHVILIMITLVIGGWWYVTHPGDLQGAAVPPSVAGICVSAFWGLFMILGRKR